jgi:hypothetical protein
MKATTISAALPLPNEALLLDIDALYRCLQTVPDQRSLKAIALSIGQYLDDRGPGEIGRAR